MFRVSGVSCTDFRVQRIHPAGSDANQYFARFRLQYGSLFCLKRAIRLFHYPNFYRDSPGICL